MLYVGILTNLNRMKVTERRLVKQEWYETDTTKTGWDSHGWTFDDGTQMHDSWTIVYHLTFDKHYNLWVWIAEREVDGSRF